MKGYNRKKWLLVGFGCVLVIMMTASDRYYSKLAADYSILERNEFLEGTVTGIKIHHKYTYLELDSLKRRLIPPSFLYASTTDHFHKMVSLGDHFVHEVNSTDISLERLGVTLNYLVSALQRE